jgi:GTP-binding protein HflX
MDVLLVSLSEDLGEIQALIASAGYGLRRTLVQRRDRPDPRSFVGKGKLEELKDVVGEVHPDAVVFAGTLRASQHHELEKALKVQCFDRLRVILDIFTQRAHSREAKLQVEFAMLQYEVPILKEWIHSGTAGERPGFMAGGEYRVDAYYETVKRRMKKVRDELEHVRKERAFRRDHRQRRGFYHVSITGYANAGKSSLFNVLSGERVLVEDRLFTTLSTTTRTLDGGRGRILLTDTVGFVSNVPLWLVEAFHSTLEEVHTSDLVLLLVDASDALEEFRAKLELAANTLVPGMDAGKVLPVVTKVDCVDPAAVEERIAIFRESPFARPPLRISTSTQEGLSALRGLVEEEFRFPNELTVRMTQREANGVMMNWLHEETEILAITYPNGAVEIRLRCRDRDLSRISAIAEVIAAAPFSTSS